MLNRPEDKVDLAERQATLAALEPKMARVMAAVAELREAIGDLFTVPVSGRAQSRNVQSRLIEFQRMVERCIGSGAEGRDYAKRAMDGVRWWVMYDPDQSKGGQPE